MKHKDLIIVTISLLTIFCFISLFWFFMQEPEPDITPTLAISATPSSTPSATFTPTPTVAPSSTATVDPPPSVTATGTAVPPPSATVTVVPPSPTGTPTPALNYIYLVQPGDHLCGIALQEYGFCSKWGIIWEANGRFRQPHLIYPGQEVVIPNETNN
jgi:nucleoid-associated protein YgaU